MDDQSDTVKFNVGGKQFTTTRNLINQQPNSMLSTMISDTWNKSNTDDSDDKPIFIDRSGDIFHYVLEYMRYGSVFLPTSIPTEMFTRDLEYYLLKYDVSTITDGEQRFAAQKKEHDALKKKYEDLVGKVKKKNNILRKAKQELQNTLKETEE